MSNKVPQIRFNGYSDAWVQRKLADVVSISAGGDVDKTKLIEDGGYPVLANALTNSGIVGYYDSYKVEAPAVTVTGRGDVGHAVARHVNFTPVVRLLSLKSEVLDADFLANMLNQTNILVESTGVPQLTAPQLGSYKILYPHLNEQTKIGKLLNAFDNLIAANQRKLDLLKKQKKGYLQKMFPKNGEKVPELRFAGFADDWEERKLGELSNIVGGGTPSTSNPEYWDGDIDWYAPAEIGEQSYVSKSKKTITELGLKKSSARILPVGTVLFTSRAGIGNTAILAKEATTNQGFQSIVPDQNKLDSYFIFSRTNELKRYGEVTGAGSTFVEVSGKQMSKMSIMVPELSEQQKIGSFFKQLDDTIALHQRKLDLLKEQKKGFLQEMFV